MREPTFPIYKKFRFVFWGILLLVNAMPAFSDNCNVPLNNLGSNLDCRQRWDLYNYLHNAQTVLNFERAALSVKMNDTDSIRAFKVAAVDSLFSAVDMLSIIKDAKTADTLVKDIATLNDLGLTAASTYRDVIGDDMDVELQNLLGDISACAYDAIFDSKISALKPFDAVFDTGLCLAPIAFSSWYNLKATFAFDNIAERFNSVTIASTYLLDCYIDDSCSKTPDETANTLGFTNDWWRTSYDSTSLNTLISNVKNSVTKNTNLRINNNNSYSTPVVLSESQLPKIIPLPETPPTGTDPQPIVGNRTDLEPDFDVKDETDQKELSSNCNNCSTTPLIPGQKIIAKLKTEISNADASGFKRDSSSKSIEGYVWWKIEGKTDWALLTGSLEYTISNLVNGSDKSIESYPFIVPDNVGDILAMKACVDGDDEIYEEGEDARMKITNPDQSSTTNNCSRTERFFIIPPTVISPQPVSCQPPLINDPIDNQKCITPSPLVTNIIPIITDLLLADPELTVNIKGKGIVTSTPAGINCPGACIKDFNDQKIILTAKPKKGHVFVGWSDGCGPSKRRNICKLDMIEDRAITATFKKQ